MKNLFAAASYSFNNFYNNLNTQGQMVFTTIIFLIVLLCVILFFTYVIQEVKAKKTLRKLRAETKKKKVSTVKKNLDSKDEQPEVLTFDDDAFDVNKSNNEIERIKDKISDALNEQKPIDLTNFEEDQEKNAIISVDELYEKAKELEIVDDDNGSINYLEKYNLQPAEVTGGNVTVEQNKTEVKAFKVSQVISPIYGVKKDAINNDKK